MLTLHRLGFMLTDGSPDVVQLAYGEFIQSQVDELSTVVDKTMDAVRTVTSDTGLKKAGITERLRAIGDSAVDRIRTLTARRRTKLDNDLAEATEAIPTRLASTRPKKEMIDSLSRGDPTLRGQIAELIDRIKYQEIRTMLLAYAEKGLVEAELLAGAEYDFDTLMAIETAPKLIRDKLVNPAIFQQARDRWLEYNMPDQFKALSTVKTALGLFEHNDQQARKTIGQACGVPLLDVPTVEEVMAATA